MSTSIFDVKPGVDFFVPSREDTALKIDKIHWRMKDEWDDIIWVPHIHNSDFRVWQENYEGDTTRYRQCGWEVTATNGRTFGHMDIWKYLKVGVDAYYPDGLEKELPQFIRSWSSLCHS
tara:strand:+ start:985 stop:1341 length:357 start_codon:yes stop_codon:yes gene_type:complete